MEEKDLNSSDVFETTQDETLEQENVVSSSEPAAAPVNTDLEDALQQIRELRATVEELASVADKGRLQNVRAKKKVKVPSIVHLSTLDGKIVVAWRTIKDEVYSDPDGTYHERQVIELTTEDGEAHVMPLIDRYRFVTKVEATVLSRTKVNDGEDGEELSENFVVKLIDSGREITIDSKFIN